MSIQILDTTTIPIDQIRESGNPIRTMFDTETLDELGDSIGESGLLEPIIVELGQDSEYHLIAGSRRLRATRRKGMDEILANIIEPVDEITRVELGLIENIQREELNPFDEAKAVFVIFQFQGESVSKTARRIRKPETFVRSRLQLLSLPEKVQDLMAKRKLNLEHVGVLARLSENDQVRYAKTASEQKLTEPELRTLIRSENRTLYSPANANRHAPVTAKRIELKLKTFAVWVRKLAEDVSSIKRSRRHQVAAGLADLREAIRVVENALNTVAFLQPEKHEEQIGEDPRNHGDEWSLADVQRITAVGRPSDQVLAKQLGRTVSAIRAMRSQAKRAKKKSR
jgi:ParB family chromosome partitioning protein